MENNAFKLRNYPLFYQFAAYYFLKHNDFNSWLHRKSTQQTNLPNAS